MEPSTRRLPDTTHVGRVRLQVSDISRSVAYYRDIIGLDHVGGDTRSALDGRPLVQLHERRGARAVPQSGVIGLYHFAILLPDRPSLGRFVRHVAKLGVQFGAADHLVSEAIYLWDPDGLGIEVYADRPRSEWRVHDGQLVMATDPLDFESLVASAGDSVWGGMPAGTTMGHIHLQVGDLDQARDYYHSALGMDVVVWSYPGALFMSAGGYHHHVGTNNWARRARAANDDDARLLDWELVLPSESDVAAVAARMSAEGYAVRSSGNDRLIDEPWETTLRLTPQRN